jgi:group I intron endonuclease
MTRLQLFFNTIEIFTGSLHLTELQNITKEELKDNSGVYGFLSKTTGKLYIGSSINLNIRFDNHLKGLRSNIKLQNAINKYNLQDFIFVVFEYCEAEILVSREQFYIDILKPEFNILKIAGSSLGYKHTEKSLAKMRKMQESIDKSGENNPMFGKIRIHSTETKVKISVIQGTSIFVYDSNGLLVNTFNSARKAAEYFGSNHQIILRYARNNKLFQDKWYLSFSKDLLISSSKKFSDNC